VKIFPRQLVGGVGSVLIENAITAVMWKRGLATVEATVARH